MVNYRTGVRFDTTDPYLYLVYRPLVPTVLGRALPLNQIREISNLAIIHLNSMVRTGTFSSGDDHFSPFSRGAKGGHFEYQNVKIEFRRLQEIDTPITISEAVVVLNTIKLAATQRGYFEEAKIRIFADLMRDEPHVFFPIEDVLMFWVDQPANNGSDLKLGTNETNAEDVGIDNVVF